MEKQPTDLLDIVDKELEMLHNFFESGLINQTTWISERHKLLELFSQCPVLTQQDINLYPTN